MISGRRSPNSSARSSGKQPQTVQQSQNKKIPAELVTYRLEGEMVYVEPAKDYEQALDFAQSVFPHLADIPRSRIAFIVNVRVSGVLKTVRIAPMAWPRVMQSLATYEIIDISVLPVPVISSRAAQSETDLATSSQGGSASTDEAPPKYGSSTMQLGGELLNPFSDCNPYPYRDSEKSPYFTLQVPNCQAQAQSTNASSISPSSPVVRRCTSAFGWFGKHF